MKPSRFFRAWIGLTLAALGLAGTSMVASGKQGSVAMAAVPDPASLLDQRSPGARPAGVLLQTKLGIAERPPPSFARSSPTTRVLPGARSRSAPPAGSAPEYGSLVPAGQPLPEEAAADAGEPALVGSSGTAPGFGGGFAGSGPAPIGGVGAGPGGGGGGDGTVPPVASVPEPATWLTMIVGLLAVGIMLRRRHRPATRPDASLARWARDIGRNASERSSNLGLRPS